MRPLTGGLPDQSGKADAENNEVIPGNDGSRENDGLSAAGNTGLDVAMGEYIHFPDSNDYLPEDTLEVIYTRAGCENLNVLKFSICTFADGCEDSHWTDKNRYEESLTDLQRFLHDSICPWRGTIKTTTLYYKDVPYEKNA